MILRILATAVEVLATLFTLAVWLVLILLVVAVKTVTQV